MFAHPQHEFDELAYERRVAEIEKEIYCLLPANMQRINGEKREI
jgi:hypothetical protein